MERKRFKFNAQGPEAAWNYMAEQLFRQRNRELDRVKAAVRAATVPMPSDIVTALALLNPLDIRDVLREHPGFALWEMHKSYQASYEVFERSISDLLAAIKRFEEACRGGLLFARGREVELREIEGAIQKELFAAA